MNCGKCLAPDSFQTVELCSLHGAAEEILKALKNLIRSAKVYGSHNMGPAIDEAKAVIVNAEK